MTSENMNNITGINLPVPSPATRQVGVSLMGSPISLTRSTSSVSGQSDIRTPEESLRDSLAAYKSFLLREIQFIDSEITALIERAPDPNPSQEASLQQLRNGLKIRYNNLQTRLARVNALLEVI
jgi:hypothetical protein